VELCNAHDRAVANSAQFCTALRRATGVWFSGGYQALLADRYVDTTVQKLLHDVLRRNGVVGGCSAGASILSRVMIKEGETKPVEARGLDLIPEAIIDQHFLQRNRLWRMQEMLEVHPDLVGLGIDEDTALFVEARTWRLKVVGESYAIVCLPPSGPQAVRIEILKPGDDISLAELRKNHLAYKWPVPKTAA
jgi:cyanophycinase